MKQIRFFHLQLIFLSTIFCVSCTPLVPMVDLYSVFNPEDANYINEPGSASIKGAAFVRKKDGSVITCAGGTVNVMPITEYAQERITHIYGSPAGGYAGTGSGRTFPRLPEPPTTYLSYSREVICGPDGRFEVSKLSPGEYYVITSVQYQKEYQTTRTGNIWADELAYVLNKVASQRMGMFCARVDLEGDETEEITLSVRINEF